MSRKMKVAACCMTMTILLSGGMAPGRGFRGGGGGGGFRGGGGGEFRGGYGGGYGGMSHLSPAPSRSSYQRPESGYGSFNGRNPYAGGAGGGSESGSRSGSYTTQRGGTIDYGAAGIGGRGDQGGAAGRGVYGIQGTTAGGRDYTDVGRAGGVVGPGGTAVGGRSNLGAVSGPNGVAVGGSRSVTGVGPEGAVRAGERGGVAAGPGGVVAGGSRGGVAVGAGGAVAGRGYGVAGYRPYGNNVYGAYHQGWVHGCWNGHGSAWGWGYPGWAGVGLGVGLGWGLASWGYGSSLYGMGYMPYANPYYSAPTFASVGYDYSQPIDTTIAPPEDSVAAPAVASFDAARDAFKQGAYDRALQQAGDALAKTPNDSDLHEFRGLCLFALKRYDDSAAAIYGVLSVGPGWDWTTLVGLYPDVDTYTGQLRALEGYCVANPGSAAPRFVLAYHYLSQGQPDAAARMLREVVALKPDDTLSAKLLRQLDPPKDIPTAATNGAAAPADSSPPAGAEIAGTWVARPAAGTTITLAIQPGGDFNWKVEQGGRSQQFVGASTYGSGLLTLARTGGPALVGRVSWTDRDHMTFRIVGDGPADDSRTARKSSPAGMSASATGRSSVAALRA